MQYNVYAPLHYIVFVNDSRVVVWSTDASLLSVLTLMQMLKCIEVDEKLKSMDQEITVNPQFVQKVQAHESSIQL